MDTKNFVHEIEIEYFSQNMAKDVEIRLDISGHSNNDNRIISIGKGKKVIDMVRGELGGKIITEFVALKNKTYGYRKINNFGR